MNSWIFFTSHKNIIETFDASISIWTDYNTRKLSGVDPKHISRSQNAPSTIRKTSMQRAAESSYKKTVTVYPNNAKAQEADMSLPVYTEFVYGAVLLNDDDPVSLWKAEEVKQLDLVKWLKGRNQVVIHGTNVDVTLYIKDRSFVESAGRQNFPSGEIFTSPVEDSVNG